MPASICPACGTAARLTDGHTIAPHRPDLALAPFWACTLCEETWVGCRPGTEEPLGELADAALREVREMLYERRLVPLVAQDGHSLEASTRVLSFLAHHLGLPREACDPDQFTLEQCRAAWTALTGVSYADVRAWARLGHRARKLARAAA